MKFLFEATTPEDIEFTLTISMRMDEWNHLREQLETSKSPSWKLSSAIADMVLQARKSFMPKKEGE